MTGGDPPSSRAATVSGSDDPKSARKGVSLEGWRAYARYWPWPRGRHGTGRGRPGKTPEEVARSMARFSVARRGWQEEGATGVRRREEGGVTEEPGDEVGRGKLGPPPEQLAWPDLGVAAMEEPMLAEGVAEKPVPGKTGGEIAMEEPIAAEGLVEYPVAVKTGGAIKESSPKEEALETPMDGKTAAEIALAKRWLPKRYPKYPSSGKFEDFLKYTDDCKRIRELNEAGYARARNLPTWGVESEDETKASVEFEERGIVLKAGESVVFVSSSGPGHKNTCVFCSGVIISCGDDGEGTIRILTSSGVLYDHVDELRSTEQKVSVKLPNSRTRKYEGYEGHVLYVNKHYNIAILKVYVGSSMATLSFGSMPRYGQRVIALGRDSKSLFHRKGIISTLERTSLGRTHYMFPKSENGFPLISTGGPVIGEDGKMVGIITCHVPETAMMSISIVQSCLDMWKEYICIARPQINMDLRTVNLLPVYKQDPVHCLYNRSGGFIIDGVEYDSNPEKVGIRKGDIIEIVDETCGSTLPELEVYLLKHGLKFLPKVEGLASTKELEMKIRVHDLVEGSSTDTQLCIPVVYEEALP